MDLGKILIVDDVKAIREILKYSIGSIGKVQFLEATNGKEGMDKIRATPDLAVVISDYYMKPGTGFEVYKELRRSSHIPFLLHTSDVLKEPNDFTGAKNFFYLTKPLDMNLLKDILVKGYSDPSLLFSETSYESGGAYAAVQISLLSMMKNISCNLFVKINEKFQVIHKAGSFLSDSDVARYRDKKIETLYLKKEDQQSFIAEYQKAIASTIDSQQNKVKII